MSERVPLGPFQKAFLEQERLGEITGSGLARRMGWTRLVNGLEIGDSTRALRYLGLRGTRCGRTGNLSFRRAVNYPTGVLLCRALGLDPVDVGV